MKEKKGNWFIRIVSILFIIFMGVFISSVSGYNDEYEGRKVALTDQKLKEFEADVLNGENVDIKEYLEKDDKDYSNKFTKAGEKITESMMMVITDGLSGLWDAISYLFL